MVKFVFHLLDLSSGIILLYQKLIEFNPGNLVSFFYPNRLAKKFLQDRASSVKVTNSKLSPLHLRTVAMGKHNLQFLHFLAIGASLGLVVLSVFAMLAACASRVAENTLSN
ncbi:hypothetical protein Tco_1292425 [Tanacetum coccineum]